MEIYQVTVEDLSHLGGPMGTEYVETITTELFSSREEAFKYMNNYDKPRNLIDNGQDRVYDCGYIGFRITTKELK